MSKSQWWDLSPHHVCHYSTRFLVGKKQKLKGRENVKDWWYPEL